MLKIIFYAIMILTFIMLEKWCSDVMDEDEELRIYIENSGLNSLLDSNAGILFRHMAFAAIAWSWPIVIIAAIIIWISCDQRESK